MFEKGLRESYNQSRWASGAVKLFGAPAVLLPRPSGCATWGGRGASKPSLSAV